MDQAHEQLNLQISELVIARPLAESVVTEIDRQEQQEHIRYQREASERLREVELELVSLREQLERAADQANRTEIISPVDGVVQGLQINTIGGVIEPGQPILQVVPIGESLVVEAHLPPADIGHVHAGQRAVVRLSTYDFFRYGDLEGVIEHISADRHVTPEGAAYYLVRIRLDQQILEPENGETYPILPGMEAEIDIQIGTRTALQYMLEPVLKLRQDAFGEG